MLLWHLVKLIRNYSYQFIKAGSGNGLSSVVTHGQWPLKPLGFSAHTLLLISVSSPIPGTLFLTPSPAHPAHSLSEGSNTPRNYHPHTDDVLVPHFPLLSTKPMKTVLHWASPNSPWHLQSHTSRTVIFSLNPLLLIQNYLSHKMYHHLWSLQNQKLRSFSTLLHQPLSQHNIQSVLLILQLKCYFLPYTAFVIPAYFYHYINQKI